MREAIRLSRQKMRTNQGGPFGAIVVRNGKIVGRGWNQVVAAHDPTARAKDHSLEPIYFARDGRGAGFAGDAGKNPADDWGRRARRQHGGGGDEQFAAACGEGGEVR